jgi:hypothetical protein
MRTDRSMTRRFVASLVTLLALTTAAHAQSTSPSSQATVQDIVTFLVTNQGVATSDFDKDRAAAEATRATLSNALLASIATVPVSSSSSGFSYRLNPAIGTVERASQTFGPFYVERALTAGAGQASLGFTLQYTQFTSLDGNDLRDGSFVTVANQFRDEPTPFDIETLTLDVKTRTAMFVANVGVTDRIDIGTAVPFVRLDISGSRVNNYRGTQLLQARATAETSGLGDIAIRSKVRLTPDGPGAVAAGVEARLPTGRDEDLLGTGELAMRFTGLASYEAGITSVYGNFTLGMGGIGRELAYSGAVAVAASPRLTIVGELLMRQIEGLERIDAVSAPHPRIAGVNTIRLVPTGDKETTAFSVAGIKWNVSGTWLLHAHVLMPIVQHGLTAEFTPAIAVEHTFSR